jgi:protein-L-isoaspartate O-methyltransferase
LHAQTARLAFAEELRFTAKLRSPAVVRAFATVLRESFVRPGPCRIRKSYRPRRLLDETMPIRATFTMMS